MKSEQCWRPGLPTWVASPGRARARMPALASTRPPPRRPSPGRGQPPTALTQQREGGVLSLRGPRFSRPPLSGFPFSGSPGARTRSGQIGSGLWCNPRAHLRTPRTNASPRGSVGAMNNAGEAPLFPRVFSRVLSQAPWTVRPCGERPGMGGGT